MSDKFKITGEEINQTLMHSPYALSDSPYQRGLGAGQIKKYFYDFIVTLAQKLNIHLEDVGIAFEEARLELEKEKAIILEGLEAHNKSELSHSDIRELVLEAQNKAHGAFDLASGKSKVHVIKSFMQIFTLHAMDTSVFREGDLFVCVDKNVPDAVVARLDEYAVSECEALFSSTDLENGNVSIEPRAGETYVMSYREGQTTMYFSVTCIESGIDVEEIVKKAVDSIAVDTKLSDTSTNPVENRVIDQAIKDVEAYVSEHVTEYEAKVNSALNIIGVQAGQISSLQVQTGDMKLVGEKILTEPDSTIDFTELKPYKEIFIQLEVLCDKATNGNILSRTLDVHQNYWMFSGSMSLPVNDVRYFYIYAKEIVERQWLVMYPDGLLSNVYGESGANKNCKISYATRKEQATRFPTSVRIGLPSSIATNFVEGTVARIYTREGENEE